MNLILSDQLNLRFITKITMSEKQPCIVCTKPIAGNKLSAHTLRCQKKRGEAYSLPYPIRFVVDGLMWIASILYNLVWDVGYCFGGMCFTSAVSIMAQFLLFLMIVW